MKYAGFWKRSASILIDIAIFLPFIFLRFWCDSKSKTMGLVAAVLYSVFLAVYNVWFVAKKGQTPGKMVVGIKIVKVDGTDVTWKEALIRHALSIIFGIFFVMALFYAAAQIPDTEYVSLTWKARNQRIYELYPLWFGWVNTLSQAWTWSEIVVLLFNKKKRALHDFMAGTVVVHTQKIETVTANQGADHDAANNAAQVTP